MGKCSQYEKEGLIHQYGLVPGHKDKWPAEDYTYVDSSDLPCFNLWTGGNIIASAQDVGQFFYDILGTESIISKETQEIMQHFEDIDWKVPLGLGLMYLPVPNEDNDQTKTDLVGNG